MDREMDEIVVYHSRWKMILLALGALAFVLGAIPIIQGGISEGGYSLFMCLIMALADIVFFGICFVYACQILFRNTPALKINSEGIFDDASAVGAGFVGWDEIDSFHIGQVHLQSFVCIVPKDIEAFLQRQPVWKRYLMKSNVNLVGAPITISAMGLQMSLDDLVKRVETHLFAHRMHPFRS